MNENGSESASGSARKLHERIAAIGGEAEVKISGHTAPTAGARPALSIADVDRVLGPLMDKHGVTSDYEFLSEPASYEETTANNKTLKTYRVHLRSYVTCGATGEVIARELWDEGSNVSGAVSFALKRYLRALFKLAEDDDTQQAQQRQAQRSDFTPPRAARAEASTNPYSDGDGDVGQVQRARVALGVAPPEERYSARELADRGPLYDAAKALGHDESWINALLDTPRPDGKLISKASLRKELEKERDKRAAKQGEPAKPSEPQDGGKEAEAGKDPKALVCPFCGSADAPGDIASEPGRMRCWGGKGGCAKAFDQVARITREEWDALSPMERAELAAGLVGAGTAS